MASAASNPQLPTPLDRLPGPAKALLTLPGMPLAPLMSTGSQIGQVLAPGVQGGLQRAAQAIGGTMAIPAVALEASGAFDNGEYQRDRARSQALMDQGIGTLLAHPGRTMEALRTSENPLTSYLAGGLEMSSDPVNILAPLAKPLAVASKSERLLALLNDVDRAQSMPIEMLAGAVKQGAGKVAKSQLLRRVVAENIPTTGKAGSIAQTQMPKVAGKRQLGPGAPSAQLGLPDPGIPLPPASAPPLPPEVTLPPRALPSKPDLLSERVAAIVNNRPLPREVIPAMGPLPLPQTREAKLASRIGALFPEAVAADAAVPVAAPLVTPARPTLPQRQAPDLGARIAGRYGPQATTPSAREAFDTLIASRDGGKMGSYLPSADFFAKRLGVPVEEAQTYIDDLVARGVVGDAMGTLAFKPGTRAAARAVPQLAALPDEGAAIADRAYQATALLDEAKAAAYGNRVDFAWPALLKKLGAVEDRFGRVVANSRDITDDVLMYLDDHAKLTGRKAINARYAGLADEVTPPADATDAQLDELIAETTPNATNAVADVTNRVASPPMSNVDIPSLQAEYDRLQAAFIAASGAEKRALAGPLSAAGDALLAAREAAPAPMSNVDIPAAVARGAAAKSELFDDAADVAQRVSPELDSLVARQIATPEQLRAMRGTPDEAIRTLNDENKARFAARLAAAKAGVPLDQLPSVTPPSLRTNTPTGSLPGVDMRPQFGGPALTSIADKAISDAPMPLKLEMQYGGMAPEAVQRVKQVDAGQADMFGDLSPAVADTGTEALRAEFQQGLAAAIERGSDDEAFAILDMASDYGYPRGEASALYDELKGSGSLVDQQRELIESGPYFSVFKYFNRNGELKKVNPLTGKPLIVREGGKISKGRSEVWNLPGSGYDDVAAEAMASVGGYNAGNAPPAEEFWSRAQQAFKQYQQLKKGTEIAPSSFAGDIAAGGGGGGGLGIVANRGGLQLLPPLNGPVPQGLRKVAADVAENVGAIAGLARESAGAGLEANAAAGKSGKFIPNPREFYGYWKRTTVEHPKNLLQDETWVRLVTRALQGKEASDLLAPLRREMRGRLGLEGRAALPQSELDELAAIGLDDYTPEYGQALAASEKQTAKELSRAQRVVANVGLSVLNPASVITTPLGLGASALRGLGDAGWSGFFQSLNGVLQHTGRIAIARTERNAMLAQADTLLRQRYGIADNALPAGGMFSPQQVEKVAGQRAADHWAALRDTSVKAGEQRAKSLLGDYSEAGKRGWEKAIGGPIPYASWAVRAYPVVLQMALQHPLVALGVYHYLRATVPPAGENGRPEYTAGMIPIDDKTPLVGLLARYLLGGAEGTAYVDPVGSFSPVGGELFQTPDDSGGEKNWYQQANQVLGRVGLPQVGPLGSIPAYALGLDFKAPNMGSRTRGIEEALALVPGNPQLPNVGASALREVRGALSPRAEGQIPGAEGDKTPEAYDPITRRYGELVMRETGKPLNDPTNARYLATMADPSNPLLQQARQEVLLGGAARNVTSLTSPIYAAAQTDENKGYRAAAKDVPYTFDEIEAAEAYPRLKGVMEQANAGYRLGNPAADTYKVGSREDAAWEQLHAWEKQHQNFLFVVGPAIYNRERRKKMIELGLAEPAGAR